MLACLLCVQVSGPRALPACSPHALCSMALRLSLLRGRTRGRPPGEPPSEDRRLPQHATHPTLRDCPSERSIRGFAHVEFSSVNAKTIAQSCAGEAAKHARRIGARRRRDRPAREGAAICCRHADDSSSRPRHAAPFESDASTATNCKWVARLTGAAPRAAAKKRSETRHDVFTQRVVPFLRVCPH